MFCRECGKKIKEGVKFCGSCGTPVSKKQISKPKIVSPRDEPEPRKRPTDKYDHERKERGGYEERSEHEPRREPPGPSRKCPVCNNKLEYIEKYQKYYCDRCRKYPYDERVPQQVPVIVRSLYASTLIVSLIGGILLITTEFSGGYSYHSGSYGFHTTISIGPWGLLFAVFFGVAMLLFIGSIISIRGLSPTNPPSRNMVWVGFGCALTVLIITILGGISSFVFIDTQDIWLSAGFYGGSIGSLLTTILFWMIIRYLPATPKPIQPMGHYRYPPNQGGRGRPYRY